MTGSMLVYDPTAPSQNEALLWRRLRRPSSICRAYRPRPPVATWIIVNGPVANKLGLNATFNCLGQGNLANATLGRALRLVLQNAGSARPGEMDRATQGQPGKYTFCCAENGKESPWDPLHVERGFSRECSTVTVVGAAGTLNMNTHAKDADDLLRVIADTLEHPTSNDYWIGENRGSCSRLSTRISSRETGYQKRT